MLPMRRIRSGWTSPPPWSSLSQSLDEIRGEFDGQPGPGHAQVAADEEHRGADVVLDLGDHLLFDGDLVAARVDEQGPQDGHEHDGAADEELDHGEARGPFRR